MKQMTSDSHLLASALAAAVPIHMMNLHQQGGPTDSDMGRLAPLAQALGEHGDILLFGGGKEGDAADLFNQLAFALAVLSYAPGGVKAFGSHWETQRV